MTINYNADAARAEGDYIRARDAARRTAEALGLDGLAPTASIHATPTTPLERLVAMYGVDAAFKMWAASRRGARDRYSAAYRAALTARNDALHTEKDAVADAKEARLARRAAAAAAAEARASVAVARAADARARV